MMSGVLLILNLATLLTVTTAQCSGNLTNSSFVLSWSVNNTNVRFTMSAPSNGNQYIVIGFLNSSSLDSSVLDLIIAGDNGQGQSFVEDWLSTGEHESPVRDTQQDLTQTSTTLSNGILTASFTRPIVSSDETHDHDLNVCRHILWGYGGNVSNFTSPFTFGSHTPYSGIFDAQICLPDVCQCSGSLRNSSFVLNWSADVANVRFTMSAPSSSNQYIAIAFSNSSSFDSSVLDLILAGDNGQGQSFVEDRWFDFVVFPLYDTQQDITQTSTSLSNGVLMASFTRPIVSSDKTQDLDLDVCRHIVWSYGGTVTNFTSPITFNVTTQVAGFFEIQICLPDNCQGATPSLSPSSFTATNNGDSIIPTNKELNSSRPTPVTTVTASASTITPVSATPTATSPPTDRPSILSGGVIAGIITGIVVLLVLIIVVLTIVSILLYKVFSTKQRKDPVTIEFKNEPYSGNKNKRPVNEPSIEVEENVAYSSVKQEPSSPIYESLNEDSADYI